MVTDDTSMRVIILHIKVNRKKKFLSNVKRINSRLDYMNEFIIYEK